MYNIFQDEIVLASAFTIGVLVIGANFKAFKEYKKKKQIEAAREARRNTKLKQYHDAVSLYLAGPLSETEYMRRVEKCLFPAVIVDQTGVIGTVLPSAECEYLNEVKEMKCEYDSNGNHVGHSSDIRHYDLDALRGRTFCETAKELIRQNASSVDLPPFVESNHSFGKSDG